MLCRPLMTRPQNFPWLIWFQCCEIERVWLYTEQVNLCQKLLFLHQLTHNMTTDCSLFMKIVSSEYLQNMLCTQIVVFVLFWHSQQFWYTICSADVASFWKRFTCTTLLNSCQYPLINYFITDKGYTLNSRAFQFDTFSIQWKVSKI